MAAKVNGVAHIDLYWLPLGAGGHFVRLNGRVFEAVAARVGRRAPQALYHSALEVHGADGTFVIEQAPVGDAHGERRGVVAEGPVGARFARHFRLFRYEIRRWPDGADPGRRRGRREPAAPDRATRWSAQRVLELIAADPDARSGS